jgi:hypothetical protein
MAVLIIIIALVAIRPAIRPCGQFKRPINLNKWNAK